MKRLLPALFLCLGAALFAQTPYYTDDFSSIDPTKWQQNGTLEIYVRGLISWDPNGGSLISLVPPPDGSGQYEVRTVMDVLGASWPNHAATFVTYLGASLDALSGPMASGQYYAVELQNLLYNPTYGSCQGTLAVYKRFNGVVTLLASSPMACRTGGGSVELRAVRAPGTILIYIDGVMFLTLADSEITGGLPGVGVRGDNLPISSTAAITWVGLYPPDRTPPTAVVASSVASWPSPNSVDLQWQGTDDPGGYGVYRYDVYRNGALMGSYPCCGLTDAAASPSTTYTYTIYAVDYFLNYSTGTTVSVATPPSGAIDPRRVGVRPTGSYWGGGGERIDTRSGNLNFSMPVVQAQGRGGSGVTFALSYNSQLWRMDPAATWRLGRDVGYGFGWRLMAGSITRYWSNPWTIHHYVFTDSTGAEYRLDVNTNGIWTSREGLHVEYDAPNRRLYFPDGSFWVMGAVSSGVEQDAGTRYPTLMQDTNGNQILIRYQQGLGSPWADSSARISQIEDVRAQYGGAPNLYVSFGFSYNSDPIPHLTGIGDLVGSGQNWGVYCTSVALYSPFSPPVSYGETKLLQSVVKWSAGWAHTFEYSGSSGELTKVTLPFGGSLRWAYRQFTYTGSRTLREVQYRYLRPSSGASELTYTLTRDDSGDASRSFHAWTRLADPSGPATRWAFSTDTGSPWSLGLQTSLELRPSATGTAVRKHDYTWTQDAAGTPYISAVLTTLDVGQSYQKQSKTEQTLDTHGNLLQTKVYDYGNLTTPARTYNYTYVSDSPHTSIHIWNRLYTADVTDGTNSAPLARIFYDGLFYSDLPGYPPIREWTSPGSPAAWYRGNVSSSWTPGVSSSFAYYITGDVASVTRNGLAVSVSPDSTKNYAVPSAMSPNGEGNLTTSMTYTTPLDLSSLTEPNVATTGITYDAARRPVSVTSPHGAVTTYTYTNSPPTVTATINGRWTKTTMDGLGRAIRVERGDGAPSAPVTKSIVDTEYTACACSPFGKAWRVSQPYAPGGTVYWTTNTYDCLGRTTQVSLPGGTGSTTYVYQGNTTKVTDPAGKWKKFTTNALGNLVQVTEPNPAGGNHETYYTYNLANKLTLVSMTRGSFTQTRTFVYDSDQRLISAANPENGTVTYTYNGDSTLQKKTDAKGQRLEYTYDAYKRVTQIRKYNSAGVEVPGVTFTYDQNPVDPYYSLNAWGRRATAQYQVGDYNLTEMYSYTPAGRPTKKKLRLAYYQATGELEDARTYDDEGRVASVTYPGGSPYTYGYDSMGRPNRLSQGATDLVTGVTYGPAGELTAMTWGPLATPFSETRTYNPRLQLTRLTVPGQVDLEYRYSATQNNGQITQFKDWGVGEEVSYSYDSLSRLISAVTTGPEWGQSYAYDGFGNRTSVTVTKGTAPAGNLSYDGLTNHITNSGFSYDANGNLTNMPGVGALSYDIDNRLAWDWATSKSYAYDAENRRVWKSPGNELYFYGVDGRRVGTYQVTAGGQYWLNIQPTEVNLHFAGRRIKAGADWVVTDRLGSVVKRDSERLRYFPWGEEQVTSTQNRDKFGTYYRDSTGLDYADQRYYASQHGRFLTPDPYRASGGRAEPQSWNRYTYVENDPVNFADPRGLLRRCPAGTSSTGWSCVVDDVIGVEYEPTRYYYGPESMPGGGGRDAGGSEGDRQSDDRESRFAAAAAAAKQNWQKVSSDIRVAVSEDSVFTPEMIDCIAGIEATWDRTRDGPDGRTGLFQYNQGTWENEYDNTTPWSVANARSIETAVGVVLGGLQYRLEASQSHRPDRTAEEHLARALSMFNGEAKYGVYGYGNAVMNCAKSITANFEQGFRAIWDLTNP